MIYQLNPAKLYAHFQSQMRKRAPAEMRAQLNWGPEDYRQAALARARACGGEWVETRRGGVVVHNFGAPATDKLERQRLKLRLIKATNAVRGNA